MKARRLTVLKTIPTVIVTTIARNSGVPRNFFSGGGFNKFS